MSHHLYSNRYGGSLADLVGDAVVQLTKIADHSTDETSKSALATVIEVGQQLGKRPRDQNDPSRIVVVCVGLGYIYHRSYSDADNQFLSASCWMGDLIPVVMDAHFNAGDGWSMSDESELTTLTRDEHCVVFSFVEEDIEDPRVDDPAFGLY